MTDTATSAAAPRGRPNDPGKREALLAAARRLFIAHGLGEVTVEDVIAEAGVSRATFYTHFPDKGSLLEAMCARESRRLIADGWLEESIGTDLQTALTSFGERFLTFLSDPDMLGLERLVMAVTESHPDLAPRLFAAGPGRGRAILGQVIANAQAQGRLVDADPDQAVSDLMGLWQGMLRVELNFGFRGPPHPEELTERARHGVRQFLRLYGQMA